MIPTKAYILRIDTPKSKEYSALAAESCENVGMKWEYHEGFTEKNKDFWGDVPVKFVNRAPKMKGAAAACTASHIAIWTKIVKDDVCGIVLEHDSLLLHNMEIDIPDRMVVALGYKVIDPENYDHVAAGPPKKIEPRRKHGGAHAYCLTPATARALLVETATKGVNRFIDNSHFLRSGNQVEAAKLGIIDPIAAIGWVRESTIWKKAAVDNYLPLLDSFKENYKSQANLGLKRP